ncbi:MAG: DNA repair protein RadA [Halanaerobiales bacterium]
MARNITSYICEECGYTSSKWMGKCPGCDSWNTFQEEDPDAKGTEKVEIRTEVRPVSKISSEARTRLTSGIGELDRVLGGGIVNGSLILMGGAPGIGKSTLILQVASLFSKNDNKVLYISGEESAAQIKLRADRLGAVSDGLYLLTETEYDQIDAHLQRRKYGLIIVDSIQTIYHPELDSNPGSIPQIREITGSLMKYAKIREIPVILIGHVTKEGELAGPRVLEHMVDTVLQFEGDQNYAYRLLRAVKNRFGSTNEVGVFEMKERGMREVLNPSQLFLEERPDGVSGSVIVPVSEGSRTLLIEIQSLVSASTFSAPQRVTTGVDNKRVSILLAVLEKKLGLNFQASDVHLNITGGFRVEEPALDLGIITAVISIYRDIALPASLAVVGEVGLAEEVRAVSDIKNRLKELKKLGYNKIILPGGNMKGLDFNPELDLVSIKSIKELLNYISEVG